MEMIKNSTVIRRIAPIVLIMYLPVRDFFFSISKTTKITINPDLQSSSSNSTFSVFYQNFISAKPSFLFIFFTFNVLLVAVLIGFYAPLSKSASPSSSSPPPTDSYGLNRDHDTIPDMFYVDYENGSDLYFKNDEIDEEEGKDDCVPGTAHVEYLNKEEELMEREHEEKDEIEINDHEDGDEDEDGYSELDDMDLNKRIEEFIGVNNKKWREDSHNDSLMAH